MTRSREDATGLRPKGFLLALVAMTALAACAAIPNDSPVVEQLDTETGTTITRVGRPLELYRDSFLQDAAGRFAFLAPFETNQMGARVPYLWVAVPVEKAPDAGAPVVLVNGEPIALGEPGRSADFAGLHASPFKIPTPWIAMYYFKIDAGIVATLGAANDVAVHVTEATKNGNVETAFSAPVGSDARLREFAARH